MRYKGAFALVTYTSDDGKTSKQVWNPRDGVLPDQITLPNGQRATISDVAYKGPGWQPPADTAVVTDKPPAPAVVPGGHLLALGWPGQPYLEG